MIPVVRDNTLLPKHTTPPLRPVVKGHTLFLGRITPVLEPAVMGDHVLQAGPTTPPLVPMRDSKSNAFKSSAAGPQQKSSEAERLAQFSEGEDPNLAKLNDLSKDHDVSSSLPSKGKKLPQNSMKSPLGALIDKKPAYLPLLSHPKHMFCKDF